MVVVLPLLILGNPTPFWLSPIVSLVVANLLAIPLTKMSYRSETIVWVYGMTLTHTNIVLYLLRAVSVRRRPLWFFFFGWEVTAQQ